jgi:formylmethanofuran dehydrogenase subunit B
LQIRTGREFEAAAVLRALLRNIPLAEVQVLDQTGIALAAWRELLDRMKKARYGVLLSATGSGRSTAESLALARLIRELNDHAHWVHLALPTAANSAGAKNVLTWRTGFSRRVDFSAPNSPANVSGLIEAEQLLERGEVDAALVICDDPAEFLSHAAQQYLAAIPTVVIDSQQTAIWQAADVALAAALPGIEAAGTMFRMDGVPLALRRVIDSPQLADFELLRMLAAAIRGASMEFPPGKPGG